MKLSDVTKEKQYGFIDSETGVLINIPVNITLEEIHSDPLKYSIELTLLKLLNYEEKDLPSQI